MLLLLASNVGEHERIHFATRDSIRTEMLEVGLTTFQDAKPRTLILAARGVSLYDTNGVLVIRFDPTKTSVRAFGDAVTFSSDQGGGKEKFMLVMANSSFSDVAADPAVPGVRYAAPLDMSAQALAAQLSNLVGKVGARVGDGLGAIDALGTAGPLAEGFRTMQAGSSYNAVVAEFCRSLGMTVKVRQPSNTKWCGPLLPSFSSSARRPPWCSSG
jgi:hypothetical protein